MAKPPSEKALKEIYMIAHIPPGERPGGDKVWDNATVVDLLDVIRQDRERIAELEQQLAEASGACAEMRLALESYKIVAEAEMRTCQCRNCLDDRARLMRSRVLWLLPATNAALASSAGCQHAEQYRKMERALRAARAWIIEVLVSENEASPENSHTVRQIDDALAGPKKRTPETDLPSIEDVCGLWADEKEQPGG